MANVFIATLGEERTFIKAYSSLEAAVKGCKEHILSFSEAYITSVETYEDDVTAMAKVDGVACYPPKGGDPAEFIDFNFDIRKVAVLD